MKPKNVNAAWLPLLLLLALSLSGCLVSSPKREAPSQPLPLKPSASTQQPQQPYSTTANERIEGWRKRLTATPLTP